MYLCEAETVFLYRLNSPTLRHNLIPRDLSDGLESDLPAPSIWLPQSIPLIHLTATEYPTDPSCQQPHAAWEGQARDFGSVRALQRQLIKPMRIQGSGGPVVKRCPREKINCCILRCYQTERSTVPGTLPWVLDATHSIPRHSALCWHWVTALGGHQSRKGLCSCKPRPWHQKPCPSGHMIWQTLGCRSYQSCWCREKIWHDRDEGEPRWENHNPGLWDSGTDYAACHGIYKSFEHSSQHLTEPWDTKQPQLGVAHDRLCSVRPTKSQIWCSSWEWPTTERALEPEQDRRPWMSCMSRWPRFTHRSAARAPTPLAALCVTAGLPIKAATERNARSHCNGLEMGPQR